MLLCLTILSVIGFQCLLQETNRCERANFGVHITGHHKQSQCQNGLKHVTPAVYVWHRSKDPFWSNLATSDCKFDCPLNSSCYHKKFCTYYISMVKNKMQCSLKWYPKYLWCKSWIHFSLFKGTVKPCTTNYNQISTNIIYLSTIVFIH